MKKFAFVLATVVMLGLSAGAARADHYHRSFAPSRHSHHHHDHDRRPVQRVYPSYYQRVVPSYSHRDDCHTPRLGFRLYSPGISFYYSR